MSQLPHAEPSGGTSIGRRRVGHARSCTSDGRCTGNTTVSGDTASDEAASRCHLSSITPDVAAMSLTGFSDGLTVTTPFSNFREYSPFARLQVPMGAPR